MDPGACFVERKVVSISSGSALCLFLLGPVFIVLNVMGGNYGLVLVNVLSTLLGLECLLLIRKGAHRLASALVIVGSSFLFFFSGYLFGNGMEFILLIAMLGGALMYESLIVRLLLAVALGSGFYFVMMSHFYTWVPGSVSAKRYGVNLVVFLILYYWILEIFRTVNTSYHREIERKNADLASNRQQLDREHEELAALTRELEVANLAKEKLFSIVSHDLRGPLGNLRATLALLEEGDLRQEEFRGMLGELRHEVDYASDCLDTLLTWSAGQLQAIQPVFTAVPLRAIGHDCLVLLHESAARKRIALENAIPAETQVRADKDQLSAILRNLVSNALKFTPAGGVVRLSAGEEGGGWRVSVSDNGIGMSHERLRQLFDPNRTVSSFGTENEKGLGLGLQICREFVGNHGGTLCAESAEGSGSTFYFTLPSADREVL